MPRLPATTTDANLQIFAEKTENTKNQKLHEISTKFYTTQKNKIKKQNDNILFCVSLKLSTNQCAIMNASLTLNSHLCINVASISRNWVSPLFAIDTISLQNGFTAFKYFLSSILNLAICFPATDHNGCLLDSIEFPFPFVVSFVSAVNDRDDGRLLNEPSNAK